MKKLISLFLSLIVVIGVFISVPVTVNAASVDDLTFELNEDGTYYIVSDCDDYASGDVVIPETYDGLPVKEIGEHAFSYCGYIISVSIPKYVLKIGDCAFYDCYQLESVQVPDGVEIIGQSAFEDCEKLSAISLPNSINSIGGEAFLYSGIYNDLSNWKNGVLYIDNHLIRANSEINETYTVKIDTITIADNAFNNCSELKICIIPDTVISIGQGAFCDSGLVNVSLGNGITEIKNETFHCCSELSEIVVPDGVKSIGESAFGYCYSLEKITLPDTIQKISSNSFYSTIYEENENNWNNNALYISNHLVRTRSDIIGGNYTIKNGTITIADNAFKDCVAITNVTIPESVVSIGNNAFSDCVRLKSITIPASVVSIGDYAFYNCYQLENIYIPNGVEIIGVSAFEDCEQLTSVFIPDSVTKIGGYAFYNCTNLMSIEIPATVISIGDRALGYCGYYFNSQQIMDFTINGTIGTEAEKYANENGFNFVDLNHTHTPSNWIVDKSATVDAEGSKHKECTECGEILETAIIPQLKPETPKVATTNELNGIKITWNAVDGAVKYNVYRRQGGYKTWTLVGTTTGTTITDTKVTSGIYYVYSVRAYNNAGQYSDFVSANTQTRKFMAVPKLTGISNATNGLYIKWNAVPGVTNGYRVYRRGAGSTYWTYLGTTKNTYYTDTVVKNKSGEYFRYTVIADGGYHSKFDTTGLYLRRLANPTLKSAVSSKTGITVKWSAISGTTGYYVYRKTANSNWVRIAAVGGTNNTTYVDKTAKKGVTYTYTVRAVCGYNTSYFNSGIRCYDKY